MNLTETGILSLAGIVAAFLIKCCLTIENSRCSTIEFCGFRCNRDVLSEEHLEKFKHEQEDEERKNNVDI